MTHTLGGEPGSAAFPFSAVVGMDQLKEALLLNAVSPAIGGVLVRGEKGTAKSTAVRALARVLPAIEVVAGCRFSCDPDRPFPECPDGPHDRPVAERRTARLVELPIGASEDRLTGSLDLEEALTEGRKRFEPGLLAAANRGLLYVDEVNLLHDHLVDMLLDAAALGVSYVERDGLSIRHQARFLLVGTMNPEEGELRPQLLDRFGLTVQVSAPRDPRLRSEVVRRRFEYEEDPAGFDARYAAGEQELASAIRAARELLPKVEITDEVLDRITSVCAAFEVDGMRADIVMTRAAAARAALHGRLEIQTEDIRAAAELVLPHRRRRNPFDAPGLDPQQLEESLGDDLDPEPDPDPAPEGPGSEPRPDADAPSDRDLEPDRIQDQPVDPPPVAGEDNRPGTGAGNDRTSSDATQPAVQPTPPFRMRMLQVPGLGSGAAGRRSKAMVRGGKVVRATPPSTPAHDLHLMATLAAAAPYQRERGRTGPGLLVRRPDLRVAVRIGKEGNLIVFLVDASGSMAARHRMAAVKGAVLTLLLDAYQRRDKVGLLSFRGDKVELLLPPTTSVDAAAVRLAELPTGGRTPLARALVQAGEVIRIERLRDPQRRPLLVVVTDGRHTTGPDPAQAAAALRRTGVTSVVIDCESSRVRLGLAAVLAGHLGADCLDLGELSAQLITDSVRQLKESA